MWNLVSCSKITEQRIRQKSYDQHVNKLNRMKSKIIINQPEQPWFIYAKKKKELKRMEDLMDIQKHNHLLLSKIKNIENRQNDTFKKNVYLTTLNGKVMQQTNLEIFKENKRICQKIIKTQAFYKTNNIMESSNNLQRVMQNISTNARRVQSAKSLANTKSRIFRSQSLSAQRPKSGYASSSNIKQMILTGGSQKFKVLTRPSSAPSIKKIKISIYNPNIQSQENNLINQKSKTQNKKLMFQTEQNK